MTPEPDSTLVGRRFPALDSMRAVGALSVLTTHTAFNAGAYTDHGTFGTLLARMDVGVAIFFVLSGFLLSRPWFVAARSALPRPPVRRYLQHRFFRIVPAYVVTAVIALLLLPSNDNLGVTQWISALTMTDIYVSLALPFGLTQTWSLATEVAFYLALPILMWLALPGSRRQFSTQRVWMLLVTLSAINVAWTLWLSAVVPSHPAHVNEWLPSFLTWFGAGLALAMVQTSGQDSRAHILLKRLADLPGVCWTMAVGLMLVAGTSIAGPLLLVPASGAESLAKNLLYTAVASLVMLPAIFGPAESRYLRALSHPWARHLGAISYSIFLIHMSVLHFVMWITGYELFRGHLWQIWTLTLVFSLLAAEVLYRLVELPSMLFKDLGLAGRGLDRGLTSAARVNDDASTKITK